MPRKAVLPVGGWGTRFLPATKAVPKAMFPIMNKPVIHYVVDEAVTAGIEQIIFVITPNNRSIEEYFSPSLDLEACLEQRQKKEALKVVQKIPNMAHFSSTPAKPRGQYQGLGVAVLNAQVLVGNEPFAVILPNDLMETGIPCMESLMGIYKELKCPIVAIHRVPLERLSTYGNVGIKCLDEATSRKLPKGPYVRERVWEITKLIQKPDPKKHEHLSDLAIIGRFILPPEIFVILENTPPGYEGEVQLIDAMEELREKGQRIYGYEFEGQYFDTRSDFGYVEAILNEAYKRSEVRSAIRKMVLSREGYSPIERSITTAGLTLTHKPEKESVKMAGTFEKVTQSLMAAGQIDSNVQTDRETEEMVFRLILGFPPEPARPADVIELFGGDYFPGTFAIGEIDQNPDFLCGETSIGYGPWVRREIKREIKAMKDVGRLDAGMIGVCNIEDDVLDLLSHKFENGRRLCDMIALQEYTDIFRRLTLALLFGETECELNTYKALNEMGGAIALAIVAGLDEWPLHELLKISLAAGLLGLNLKTSAAATSQIHTPGIIPLDLCKSSREQVNVTLHRLCEKVEEGMALDYWQDYEKQILCGQPRTLVVFTDDYIETIFDLKFIERQLYHNPNLTVSLIPRARQYGNDASYEDVMRLLEKPVFQSLKLQNKNGRLEICADGPRLGTVNGLKISQSVADRLKHCDAVFVKGARAYEMLQGIGKTAYFGFAVCREISEAVTGIDAETGALVFIRQQPYQRTFSGFRDRRTRPYEFRHGRTSFLCRVTAKDCHESDLLPTIYRDLCEHGNHALQEQTIQIAPFLDDLKNDLRRGLTLIVRPSPQVARQLTAVNEYLSKVAPCHFYYESSRFHFTIISLITACETFDVKKIPLELYERTIREVLTLFSPFEVEFMGVGATPNSIIAKGFPVGGTLEAIREMLRYRLRAAGLGQGLDERYRSRGAHITLARFKAQEGSEMIACLDKNCEVSLGRMCVQQAQLVVNDFYMSPEKATVVAEIGLTGK
ncbi:MAG: hypothetical protein KKC76_15965 [Proteobacteria bacterium]|nr:hypothetical protein [Pseudomonadota bacterium]MBU4294606.1 hypothetical protein [Pseudomonadota bacterium]MCG2747141.1 hypothetical protein [Desulfobulbaceae bacterium]